MIAAGRVAEDAISSVVPKASEMASGSFTEGQQKAWKNVSRVW
jgi:hypothetical protein